MSFQLPRDRLSVGLTRHLVRRFLAEVGVVEEDQGDVELAVSEAATNVVQHSDAEDVYEVTVTIGPTLAELRVVDLGKGFDHSDLSATSSVDDERGRGITLMNALVDKVRFISAPEQGTVVHLVKRLRFDDTNPSRRLMLEAHPEEQQDSYDEQDGYGATG
jgi:serine/threonine-protein kinase RsbW